MLKNWFKFIKNLFSLFGLIVFVIIILFLFYGETSKQRRNIFFNTVKSFVGIGEKYDGFIANTPSKYVSSIYLNLSNKFINHDFNSLNIEIDLENLKLLEKMRIEKYKKKSAEIKWAKAKIRVLNKKNKINDVVNVKLRPKGDREIHFLNLDSMSYKIDVRGKRKFILGMEEMSLQKPVTRNFTWELLYHKLFRKENLVSLNIIPIKLYRNGEYLGVFVLEEGFSKELLEKQYRKEGPIIGINENLDQTFPNLTYEYYSEKYWVSKFPDIFIKSQNNLNFIKNNFENENFKLFEYFDLDLWAKFFALSDVLKMFHGTVTKSVKLYYNPTTGLFEPIPFDGHYQAGYQDFSFIDFLENPKIDCGYACSNRNWYKLFFNENNKNFVKQYLYYLEIYSSNKYQDMIIDYHINNFQKINNFFHSEYQSSDRIFFKGVLPYYFDISTLKKRSEKIRDKILKNDHLVSKKINYQRKLDFDNLNYLNLNNSDKIIVQKGITIFNDLNVIDKDIFFKEGSVLILLGVNNILGQNRRINISGQGMLVQLNGQINLENVQFNNLKNIKLDGLNWSGAINIINSHLIIDDVTIKNNIGEDSINIVGSDTTIENLTVVNSQSDAIDLDFGKITFDKITCKNSGNDCFDTSGSIVKGNILKGENVSDKLGSFGEGSNIKIKNINGKNINIGLASKDGSKVLINEISLNNYNIPLASYNKKFFFGNSFIEISNLNLNNIDTEKILVSDYNNLIINNKKYETRSSNKKILKKIYPNG